MSPPVRGFPEDGDADWVVFFARGGCEGKCPIYSMQIRRDRRIEYDGFGYVRTSGQRVWTLREDQMDALKHLFEDARFLASNGNFDCYSVTDYPYMIIGYQAAGKKRISSHYLGCSINAALDMILLEDRIDEITGVDLLTGFAGYRREFKEQIAKLHAERQARGEDGDALRFDGR